MSTTQGDAERKENVKIMTTEKYICNLCKPKWSCCFETTFSTKLELHLRPHRCPILPFCDDPSGNDPKPMWLRMCARGEL